MRHDAHYVEELARSYRSIGKIIPINKITPNPEQPRVEVGDLTELTGSIKQNGVLEPLLVKPKNDGTWMIIAGERRWRSAGLAGLIEVPCIEFDIDEQTVAEIALIENLQRKDLTIWEEADGLAFLSRRFDYTQDEIAKKIGKSRTTVTELLTVAGLPKDIRAKCFRADISAKSTLLEIARQFDETAMHIFLDNIGGQDLKRDEIRRASRRDRAVKGRPLTGEISDPSAGSAVPKEMPPFRYVAAGGEFKIEIQFTEKTDFNRKDVLRALKEVFENIKNQVSSF